MLSNENFLKQEEKNLKENKKLFQFLLNSRPNAVAQIFGGQEFPNIRGVAEFYALPTGVVVLTDVEGLPQTQSNIFAYHIHQGGSCEDNFAQTGGHFNPQNQPHPSHAGDMPPLFAFDGQAFSLFFTKRVSLPEILGKTVIIHQNPDDFTTQPAGNSGTKIACGVIEKV